MRGRTGLAVTVLTLCALALPARTWAQPREEAQSVIREAVGEFRRHVNEYQDRLREIKFDRRPSPSARRGINDTIVNAYRSQLTAITRVRNESNGKISRIGGLAPVARNNAIHEIARIYATETHTLREHEAEALRKLRAAENR